MCDSVVVTRCCYNRGSTAAVWQKAVDVLGKRIASRQVSDDMRLRIIVSLVQLSENEGLILP